MCHMWEKRKKTHFFPNHRNYRLPYRATWVLVKLHLNFKGFKFGGLCAEALEKELLKKKEFFKIFEKLYYYYTFKGRLKEGGV